MAFDLGFQIKSILNPWSMLFHPEKVMLKLFSAIFKIHWAYYATSPCSQCSFWITPWIHTVAELSYLLLEKYLYRQIRSNWLIFYRNFKMGLEFWCHFIMTADLDLYFLWSPLLDNLSLKIFYDEFLWAHSLLTSNFSYPCSSIQNEVIVCSKNSSYLQMAQTVQL